MRMKTPALIVSSMILFVAAAAAQTVPSGFQVDNLVTFTGQTAIDFCYLPDGRIVIGGRAGLLTVYTTNAAVPGTATVGTIPSVETGSEKGLLGICADPNFATNGYIYVWYPPTTTSFMRLSRWTLGGDLANGSSTNLTLTAGSEYLILNDCPDSAFNHNGGNVRFGPDGMLYLSIGDDANSCSAPQSLTTLAGKILRLTTASLPAGAGGPPAKSLITPADNPLVGNANDNAKLVWAYGLRNPVTFSDDPVTGDLFIADVGQNAREEFDYLPRNIGSPLTAVNFGWPYMEGIASYGGCSGSGSGLTAPLDDYAQSTGGVSIMAGGFVRVDPTDTFPWPAAYDRNVFHNDYFNGTMTRLTPGASPGTWTKVPGYWGTGFTACLNFKQDPTNGDVKFISQGATYASNGGALKRIRVQAPMNQLNVQSGAAQVGNYGQTFNAPIVVRALNPAGTAPLVNQQVNITVMSGGAVIASANPGFTDSNGDLAVTVVAGTTSSSSVVKFTTPGGDPNGTSVTLYQTGTRFSILHQAATTTIIQFVTYQFPGGPTSVPYIFMVGIPGQTPLTTPFGTLGLNPLNPVDTFVYEDGIGYFGFVTTMGAIGTPNKTNVYTTSSAINGTVWKAQVIGYVGGTFWLSNLADLLP